MSISGSLDSVTVGVLDYEGFRDIASFDLAS